MTKAMNARAILAQSQAPARAMPKFRGEFQGVNPYMIVQGPYGPETYAGDLPPGVRFKIMAPRGPHGSGKPMPSELTFTSLGPCEAEHPIHKGRLLLAGHQPVVLVQ